MDGFQIDEPTARDMARTMEAVLDRRDSTSFPDDTTAVRANKIRAVLLAEIVAGDEQPVDAHRLTFQRTETEWFMLTFYEVEVDGDVDVTFDFGSGDETVTVTPADDESEIITSLEGLASVATGDVEVINIPGRIYIGFTADSVSTFSLDTDGLTGAAWLRRTQWVPDRHLVNGGIGAVIDFDDPSSDPDDDSTWPRFAAGSIVSATRDETCIHWLIDASSCRDFSYLPEPEPEPEPEGAP